MLFHENGRYRIIVWVRNKCNQSVFGPLLSTSRIMLGCHVLAIYDGSWILLYLSSIYFLLS